MKKIFIFLLYFILFLILPLISKLIVNETFFKEKTIAKNGASQSIFTRADFICLRFSDLSSPISNGYKGILQAYQHAWATVLVKLQAEKKYGPYYSTTKKWEIQQVIQNL